MKNKILIVEDEIIVANDIEFNLKKLNFEVVGIASCKSEAENMLLSTKVDLVLMDIMLKNDESGIELAEYINSKYSLPVIFLTAYTDLATVERAKYTNSYGYIVKPFKSIDLRIQITLAIYKHEQYLLNSNLSKKNIDEIDKKEIFVKSNNKLIKINKEDILYIEALKDYVLLFTTEKKYIIHTTMKDIEVKLGPSMFIRIHRSYIVNINKIESIEFSNLRIEDKDILLPIGGSYKEILMNKLCLV
jgi:DNA-binding LytR/AlgR family response regulator